MLITALTPDPRQPGYLVVEVDRARYASLPLEVVHQLELVPGLEIPSELAERLKRAADVESAYQVAARLLAMRPRSVYEVLARLRERGHNPSAAATAVGRLETAGVLDDAAYARHFARVRAPRGHGPARLLHDLLAKGVDRRVAERAIAEVLDADGVDAPAQARALAARRMGQLRDVPPRQRRRRLLAYLARRGFRGRDVQEMVTEVLNSVAVDRETGKGKGET
ncbi:MAG: regulatory protein RecX [Gemmatimonadetes bacterium]|nr:regulatory protein RecX [Gemmatimonadota bacterium]MBI2401890.1 regulatory protein RecX [Gemmatimonadota bacterium]